MSWELEHLRKVDMVGVEHFPRYVDELSKLQDAMPADPLEEVEKLLSKESSQVQQSPL